MRQLPSESQQAVLTCALHHPLLDALGPADEAVEFLGKEEEAFILQSVASSSCWAPLAADAALEQPPLLWNGGEKT